jgi:hypothetical protein
MTKVQPNSVFEMEVCGRCGGTGNYSYNQIDGTRCFGCGGTGWRYTKRGSAARQWWQNSFFMIKASDVTIGMRINSSGMKFTVVEISAPLDAPAYSNHGAITLTSADRGNGRGTLGVQCHPDTLVQLIPSDADRIASLQAAKAYQETLTKAGTVRK